MASTEYLGRVYGLAVPTALLAAGPCRCASPVLLQMRFAATRSAWNSDAGWSCRRGFGRYQ